MSFLQDRCFLPLYVAYRARRDEKPRPPFNLDAFTADWAAARTFPTRAPDIPKRIFILWDKGYDSAPDIVKTAYASWVAANPDWEVIFLDSDTVHDWVDTSDLDPGLWVATWSDVIRLRLLSQYGGVWVDATTLCMRPLEDWLGPHLRHGFFMFGKASRTRPMSNWFLASRTGAPMLEAWRQAFDGYIRGRRRCFAYYCPQHTFEYLLLTQSTFRALWADTLQLHSDGPHMLKRLLTESPAEVIQPTPQALAQVPVFKLNHRPGLENLDNARRKLTEFGLSLPSDTPPPVSPGRAQDSQ